MRGFRRFLYCAITIVTIVCLVGCSVPSGGSPPQVPQSSNPTASSLGQTKPKASTPTPTQVIKKAPTVKKEVKVLSSKDVTGEELNALYQKVMAADKSGYAETGKSAKKYLTQDSKLEAGTIVNLSDGSELRIIQVGKEENNLFILQVANEAKNQVGTCLARIEAKVVGENIDPTLLLFRPEFTVKIREDGIKIFDGSGAPVAESSSLGGQLQLVSLQNPTNYCTGGIAADLAHCIASSSGSVMYAVSATCLQGLVIFAAVVYDAMKAKAITRFPRSRSGIVTLVGTAALASAVLSCGFLFLYCLPWGLIDNKPSLEPSLPEDTGRLYGYCSNAWPDYLVFARIFEIEIKVDDDRPPVPKNKTVLLLPGQSREAEVIDCAGNKNSVTVSVPAENPTSKKCPAGNSCSSDGKGNAKCVPEPVAKPPEAQPPEKPQSSIGYWKLGVCQYPKCQQGTVVKEDTAKLEPTGSDGFTYSSRLRLEGTNWKKTYQVAGSVRVVDDWILIGSGYRDSDEDGTKSREELGFYGYIDTAKESSNLYLAFCPKVSDVTESVWLRTMQLSNVRNMPKSPCVSKEEIVCSTEWVFR